MSKNIIHDSLSTGKKIMNVEHKKDYLKEANMIINVCELDLKGNEDNIDYFKHVDNIFNTKNNFSIVYQIYDIPHSNNLDNKEYQIYAKNFKSYCKSNDLLLISLGKISQFISEKKVICFGLVINEHNLSVSLNTIQHLYGKLSDDQRLRLTSRLYKLVLMREIIINLVSLNYSFLKKSGIKNIINSDEESNFGGEPSIFFQLLETTKGNKNFYGYSLRIEASNEKEEYFLNNKNHVLDFKYSLIQENYFLKDEQYKNSVYTEDRTINNTYRMSIFDRQFIVKNKSYDKRKFDELSKNAEDFEKSKFNFFNTISEIIKNNSVTFTNKKFDKFDFDDITLLKDDFYNKNFNGRTIKIGIIYESKYKEIVEERFNLYLKNSQNYKDYYKDLKEYVHNIPLEIKFIPSESVNKELLISQKMDGYVVFHNSLDINQDKSNDFYREIKNYCINEKINNKSIFATQGFDIQSIKTKENTTIKKPKSKTNKDGTVTHLNIELEIFKLNTLIEYVVLNELFLKILINTSSTMYLDVSKDISNGKLMKFEKDEYSSNDSYLTILEFSVKKGAISFHGKKVIKIKDINGLKQLKQKKNKVDDKKQNNIKKVISQISEVTDISNIDIVNVFDKMTEFDNLIVIDNNNNEFLIINNKTGLYIINDEYFAYRKKIADQKVSNGQKNLPAMLFIWDSIKFEIVKVPLDENNLLYKVSDNDPKLIGKMSPLYHLYTSSNGSKLKDFYFKTINHSITIFKENSKTSLFNKLVDLYLNK